MTHEAYIKKAKELAEKIRKITSEHYFNGGLEVIGHANSIIDLLNRSEKRDKKE